MMRESRMSVSVRPVVVCAMLVASVACTASAQAPAKPVAAPAIRFEDVTAGSGLSAAMTSGTLPSKQIL